jgi:hypothetical protein
MANPNPSPKTRIKKGEVRNPKGTNMWASVAAFNLRRLSQAEINKIGDLVILGNLDQLKKTARDPNAPVLAVMLAAISVKVIESGDMDLLNKLLDRLVGKIKEHHHFTGNVPQSPVLGAQVVVTLPSNGREAELAPETIDVTPEGTP